MMRIENRSTKTIDFDSKHRKIYHRSDQYRKRSSGAAIASTILATIRFAYTYICIVSYRERVRNFSQRKFLREQEREVDRGSKRERGFFQFSLKSDPRWVFFFFLSERDRMEMKRGERGNFVNLMRVRMGIWNIPGDFGVVGCVLLGVMMAVGFWFGWLLVLDLDLKQD